MHRKIILFIITIIIMDNQDDSFCLQYINAYIFNKMHFNPN